MSLLDELQTMYGADAGPNDQLLKMLGGSQPSPGLDPQLGAPQPAPMPLSQQADQPQHMTDLDVMQMYTDMVNQNAAQREAGGGAPAGMHASSVTQKTETGGVPLGVEAEGVAARGQEEVGNAQIDANRLRTQGDQAAKQAEQQHSEATAENDKRKLEEAENDAKQQRLRAQQADLAKQSDEPINAHRYIDNMSIFSKGAALISAGLYGYLHPDAQGAAPVLGSLMQLAQQDTQAQIQNNEQNRSRRSEVMAQYEREYGDTTLVAKRLEADKLLTFAKEAKAQGLQAKSAEVKAQADDLVAKLQNRVGVIHNDIQKAMYGKPVETSTTYAANKAVDPSAKLDKAFKTVEALQKVGGYTPEQINSYLRAAGLPTPEGKSEFQLKNEKDAADRVRDDAKLGLDRDKVDIEREKAKELNPTEKQKLIEKVDGLAMARQGFDELDNSAGVKRDKNGELMGSLEKLDKAVPGFGQQTHELLTGLIPGKTGDSLKQQAVESASLDTKALRRAAGKIAMGLAHAESGAGVNEGEMRNYTDRLDSTSVGGFARSTPEVFREQRQKYRNLVGQYGKDAVDEMLRKRGVDPESYGD